MPTRRASKPIRREDATAHARRHRRPVVNPGRHAAEADGRILRSARSRERILEALIELIAEGDMQPTGERVAARAGYGLRTVYRHFDDMEGLYRELQTYVSEKILPSVVRFPVLEGSLEERILAAVRRRAVVFERLAPFLRSGATLRWRSEVLSRAHAETIRGLRDDLERSLPEVAPHREIAELLTSFEAWNRLRVDQKLGRERAQSVVVDALRTLLGKPGVRPGRP